MPQHSERATTGKPKHLQLVPATPHPTAPAPGDRPVALTADAVQHLTEALAAIRHQLAEVSARADHALDRALQLETRVTDLEANLDEVTW